MGSQMLLLNWNDHKSNVIGEFQQLFSRSELTDVTLACDGYTLQAHKTVLSASSSFFRSLFLHHPCKHAFVILTDVDSDDLKAIVDFMYQGQIHISQQKLTQFLKTAEKLKIKGLSTFSQGESHNSVEEPTTTASSRSESLEQNDVSSQKQPVRSHLNDSFQTNESHQSELNLNSGGAVQDSSVTYRSLKNESCEIASTIHEYCSVNILEPDFSPSLHNIPASSSEISQNQSAIMPVQSVSQETSQWVSQIFPPDKNLSSATSQAKAENQVTGTSAGSIFCRTQKSADINYKYPIHTSNLEIVSESTANEYDKLLTVDTVFHCLVCKKIFNNRSQLIAHNKSHFEEKQFYCNICNTKFTQKHGLIQHLKMHSGEKPYSCNICNKKFTRKSSVTVHKRIHTGEKPFHCKYCKRTFSDRTSIVVHERVHTKEKPFSCNICWKSFSCSSNLRHHSLLHCSRNGSMT